MALSISTQSNHQEKKPVDAIGEEKYRPEEGYHGDPRLRDFLKALRADDLDTAAEITANKEIKLQTRLHTQGMILFHCESKRRINRPDTCLPALSDRAFKFLMDFLDGE